ncbi:hypothetical protein GCM10010517_11590 [Streptosporangium fragile]|uniref:MPT63-like domain-containing protein n=1 Tax=Streptosporangium fragile TaxID=46186 RepID=A0ABN3VSG4_9ACTN
MSIVRSATVALSAALAFGATMMTGVSAHADALPTGQKLPAAVASGKATIRIASGSTEPGQGWVLYENNSPGLYIDVDTSSAHFTGNPTYLVSVGGLAHHFELTGTSTVYRPTATGFRVYIRWSNGIPLTVEDAQNFGWYVNWIGIDNP